MIRMMVAGFWVALIAYFFGVFWGLVVFAIMVSMSLGRAIEQTEHLQDELRNLSWEVRVLREQVRDMRVEDGMQSGSPQPMHRIDPK